MIAEAERSIAEHGTIAWDDVNAEIERLLRRSGACDRDSLPRPDKNS